MDTNAGHTLGPWTAKKMHTGGYDVFDPRDRDVVTVYGGGVEIESLQANARLIAAAPELLEALHLHDVYMNTPTDRGGAFGPKGKSRAAFDDAKRAAIAKATGAAS